jgi:hypothetical protein
MYRIKDWALHFENAESRKVKKATWLPLPNKHDGKGFRRLTKHPRRVEILAAWTIILQFASKCPVRGDLADENGPLTADDLADVTDFPVEIFRLAFEVLQEERFGWIEDVAADSRAAPRDIPARPDGLGARPDTSGRPGVEGKGREGNRTEENPPPPTPAQVTPLDQVVTDILAAYPKEREREGGRVEKVHVGEGDRPLIAQAMNADPSYPWLQSAKWYAKSTKRPQNLRTWLQNPTAREIVLKAQAADKGRDSPPPDPGPIGAGPEELKVLAALASGKRVDPSESRRFQNVGT